MSEFKKELRYYVVKVSDAQQFSDEAKHALENVLYASQIVRKLRDAPQIDCVVVESDWPEYEIVWGMIQARVEGRPNQITTLQSELAAAKESRDRESVAYDKLNAAYIDLNLELSKLRTTEYEYLLGEKDAQIDALRAKSTELKTSPLYACACEQFYDGKHHPECPARRQWEELQSDLAAARAEIARTREDSCCYIRCPVCGDSATSNELAINKQIKKIGDELARARKALIREWVGMGWNKNISTANASARYAHEIAHKGEEG